MPRHFTPGLSVHLIRRGVNRCTIFHDDCDREVFLHIVKGAAHDCDTDIHAFVLMSNHYHALATPHHAEALPSMMKTVGEQYVEYFNRKHARIGTLWTGRYRAIPIASEPYWLTCLRYIEQNPVRANLVRSAGEYRWSSYRVHACGDWNGWLSDHPVYHALGRTPSERQAAYLSACGRPLTEDELAKQRRPPVNRVRRPIDARD